MKRFISIIAVVALLAAMLCACGEKVDTQTSGDNSAETAAAKPLADVFTELKTKYEIADMMELKDAASLKRFYGIEADDVADFAGGINNSGVNQEEIVMILAKDADAAQRVSTALTNRLNSKLNENKDYNPEQYAIIQKCSVETDGNNVSLFISANAESMKTDYKAAIGAK